MTAAPFIGTAGAPGYDRPGLGRLLTTSPGIAFLGTGYFCSVAVFAQPRLALLGMLLLTAGIVAANLKTQPAIDQAELSLTGLLVIYSGFAFGRLPQDTVTRYSLLAATLALGVSGLVPLIAPVRSHGRWLVAALFGMLALTSLYSPDDGALRALVTNAAASAVSFALTSRLPGASVRPIGLVVIAIGCVESMLALIEPFVLRDAIWAPAQKNDFGQAVPLPNTLLSGLERSQGTFGHPLPLGLLLVLAFAILIRVVPQLSLRIRIPIGLLLMAGLLMSGNRSMLIAAAVIFLLGRRADLERIVVCTGAFLVIGLVLVWGRYIAGSTVDNFAGSGSYLHRLSAYDALTRLATQQDAHLVWFGNGWASTQRMFDSGLLQNDGFRVVDNQFILMTSQGGILCAGILLAFAGLALRTAPAEWRPAAVVVVATFFVFDSLQWPSATVLTFFILGLALARGDEDDDRPQERLSLREQLRMRQRAREAEERAEQTATY